MEATMNDKTKSWRDVLPVDPAAVGAISAAAQRERGQQLDRLRTASPFHALQVDEGALTLDQALAAAEETRAAPQLAEHAEAIRALGRRMISDAIEIGRRLAECRRLIRSGWINWLDREFGMSDRGALNFIRIYELSVSRSENFSGLDLPVSGLYLLARPSTPEPVRDDILQRAATGEVISYSDIKRQIEGEDGSRPGTSVDQILTLLPKLSAEERRRLQRALDATAEAPPPDIDEAAE
jgi:hypothetical protein